MKFLPQKPITFQGWGKSFPLGEKIHPFPLKPLTQKLRRFTQRLFPAGSFSWHFLQKVKETGFTLALDDYEKRKLSIFNQLNFLQLLTGIIVPLLGLYYSQRFPIFTWTVACMPAFISLLVLWLNAIHEYFLAQIAYFVLYPFVTSLVYLGGINFGVELSFILYGILSVFFIQNISQMLFAVGLSMTSYFVLAVVCKNYRYELASANVGFYFFNQLLAIGFIFYGLFLIKKENSGYQHSILEQKAAIAENEQLLKRQTEELTEVNSLKNKLFSIIAHDLKTPIYALRNLFRNAQQFDLPGDELKAMVPEIVNELTHTTNLMENLLQWARSQMQSDGIRQQQLDLTSLITEVTRLLRLQAEAKHIRIEMENDPAVHAFADKDMVSLVLRNLLSNAIKYTPEQGKVTIGIHYTPSGKTEVYVRDTGKGITPEALRQIHQHIYYTTKGTAGEPGTGIGLMLCQEFLLRNGGEMRIESKPGQGSTFSFTLPAS